MGLLVNAGRDKAAKVLGNPNVFEGTATASSGTSITKSTAKFTETPATEQEILGSIVVAVVSGTEVGNVVLVAGVIIKVEEKVLTVDKWHKLKAGEYGVGGSTPSSTGKFWVLPGNAPACYIALSTEEPEEAGATTLKGEITGEGLTRSLAEYSHSAGATTYTLKFEWTKSGAGTKEVKGYGIFDGSEKEKGNLLFEGKLNATAVLVENDKLTVTDTVTV